MAIFEGLPYSLQTGDAFCGQCCGSSLQEIKKFKNPYGIAIAEGISNHKPEDNEHVDVVYTKSGPLTVSLLLTHDKYSEAEDSFWDDGDF